MASKKQKEQNALYCAYKEICDTPLFFPSLLDESNAAYPSKFFKKKVKPEVSILNMSLEDSYHTVIQMKHENSWDDKKVSTFLINMLEDLKNDWSDTNLEDWSSYGILLGKKNEHISPLDVITITKDEKPTPAPGVQAESSSKEKLDLFISIITIYRKTLSRNSGEECGNNIATRMNSHFSSSAFGTDPKKLAEVTSMLGEWNLTPSYRKILAAIDMHFHRFSQHKFASIRMATMPTRYRGCAVPAALEQVAESLGLRPNELLNFVYHKGVEKDVDSICETGEEFSNEFGYFPYHLEFGTVPRSKYSIRENPTLHLWLHVLGCLTGCKRSFNATYPDQVLDAHGVTAAAAIVALHFTGDVSLKRQPSVNKADQDLYRERKQLQKKVDEMELEEAARKMSVSEQADYLLESYNRNGGLTPQQKLILSRKASIIKQPKYGSVGRHVIDTFSQ